MEIDEHRRLATGLYNRCWELLEAPARSKDDDVELLTAAFTSRWHWLVCGGAEQWIISDWMISRAAGALDLGPLALTYATRAHEATGDDTAAWLRASTAEGLALAHAVTGDRAGHEHWCAVADELLMKIVDEEDRVLIEDQLAATKSRIAG